MSDRINVVHNLLNAPNLFPRHHAVDHAFGLSGVTTTGVEQSRSSIQYLVNVRSDQCRAQFAECAHPLPATPRSRSRVWPLRCNHHWRRAESFLDSVSRECQIGSMSCTIC